MYALYYSMIHLVSLSFNLWQGTTYWAASVTLGGFLLLGSPSLSHFIVSLQQSERGVVRETQVWLTHTSNRTDTKHTHTYTHEHRHTETHREGDVRRMERRLTN